MIDKLYAGRIGARYRGHRRGQLFVLLPSPVDADSCLAAAGFGEFADTDDAWEQGFAGIVDALLELSSERCGPPEVVAPRRRESMSWWQRWREKHPHEGARITNPLSLSPRAALLLAARDDGALEFAAVEFARALLSTSDGHPLLWVWLDDDARELWPAIQRAAAGALPCETLELAWERLLPDKPVLSTALPRAMIHRTETASWSDGERTLGFQAALGVQPAEVYVPTRERWTATAPTWAHSLRETIVSELAELGVRVVERADAIVLHDYARIGLDA